MATILDFRSQSPRAERPAQAVGLGRLAEVVIFPGVRYERPASRRNRARAARASAIVSSSTTDPKRRARQLCL